MMKINIVILFVLISAPGLSLYAQELNDARDLLANERYGSAEMILEKQAESDPGNPETNYLLIKSYLEQDKMTEAKALVEANLRPRLSEPFSQIAYARYLLSTGYKKGAADIGIALFRNKKSQRNPALLKAMAEVNIDEPNGDPAQALVWLDLAAKRNKNDPDIDILRGRAYQRVPDANKAYLAYQDALKKNPRSLQANYLLGKLFFAQKNPDVYMDYFNKVYEIDSGFAPVLEDLYNHYYYRDTKQSRKFLEKFIAHTDYSIRNDYYLTDILYLDGDYSSAIQQAKKIIQDQQEKSQPRLFKLIAYSHAKSGDTVKALENLNKYFEREVPEKLIAADFDFRAGLSRFFPNSEKQAISYYTIAADMDTLLDNKIRYAKEISVLAKALDDNHTAALWLGKFYQWNAKSNNVDLFNWGLAHYRALEYPQTDSVFALYTSKYPEDIYGYYWRAQANAAIDTSMAGGLAIPYYKKVVELGETQNGSNQKMLLKAYGYLGGYEANITKDYPASMKWFEKYLILDPGNAAIKGYLELLKKWMADKK